MNTGQTLHTPFPPPATPAENRPLLAWVIQAPWLRRRAFSDPPRPDGAGWRGTLRSREQTSGRPEARGSTLTADSTEKNNPLPPRRDNAWQPHATEPVQPRRAENATPARLLHGPRERRRCPARAHLPEGRAANGQCHEAGRPPQGVRHTPSGGQARRIEARARAG